MNILKRLWDLPPREVALKLRRRLSANQGFDAEDILGSTKHMRPQRFYDFLSRYEAILMRTRNWEPLEFKGKHVLEIGCGPMLGFGPLAIFRGARKYTAIEPDFQTGVLDDQRIVERYYRSTFRDLSALYGERGSFDDFIADLRRQAVPIAKPLSQVVISERADIVVSNSCLEHISPFEESILALRKLCADDCRLINLVDFGSHRAGSGPFENIYSRPRDKYLETYGAHVNLLRAPDMISVFRAAGFEVDIEPYTSMRESYQGRVHDFWASRYSEDELFLKTGILFGHVAS